MDDKAVRGKVFKLAVSTYQMGVIMLFNQNNELTKKEIQATTMLQDNPLKVALLVCVLVTCCRGINAIEGTTKE